MRISHISIECLFNRYDYEIEIPRWNNVSILTAPNGGGKTTIFNYIEKILRNDEEYPIPVSKFKITLDDGASYSIQSPCKNETNVIYIKSDPDPLLLWPILAACNRLITLYNYNRMQFLNKLADSNMHILSDIQSDNMDKLSFREFSKLWNSLSNKLSEYEKFGIPHFKLDAVDSKFYRQNRAYLISYLTKMNDAVEVFDNFYQKLCLFKNIIDDLFIATHKELCFNFSDIINNNYDQYDWDSIKNIINVKYADTTMNVDLTMLSSGEYRMFMTWFRLIFDGTDGDIMLIDSPENSVHIINQEKFIDLLVKVCELRGSQAIVATHSPDIVSVHDAMVLYKK